MARHVLNINLIKNYKGEDIRDTLIKSFYESVLIDQSWSSLTRKVENKQLCMTLENIIFKKGIGIRARAFVNAWIPTAKRKNVSISDKSEPSLRKTLHTKQISKSTVTSVSTYL